MEIIRNYLENMFANLPNTAEVRKAKNELGQMMEDKYRELIEEGKSENEAVGTVISEFGNLDELAEELGLKEEVEQEKATMQESPRRMISFDEVKDFLRDEAKSAFGIALGVGIIIISVTWPILTGVVGFLPDALGVIPMFVMIAVAVMLFIISGNISDRWKFMKKELCSIDYATATFVHQEKDHFKSSYAVQLTIGITLCALCWVPVAVLDGITPFGLTKVGDFLSTMGVICLFVFCALGVFLIIHASSIMGSYEQLLKLNARDTVGGSFADDGEEGFANPLVNGIMGIYWPTVRAIYLIWSFLTFAWYKTWIIWPVAGIIYGVCSGIFRKKDEL